ncbi:MULTISPECIES: DNA-processing protein DprA [unclassified Corynebacterium]|uniref:DNA-processing protein DprA n=1 Tax=unclassified Corynebacterium TaxID=2624378 RepID=UPI0029C9F3C9|nr:MULTISPECIES: DNA-processing protein DprA [unclassified Corynebacterium]WPF65332.1 DNA-processing protein DprA [Corynebacterium sp. 22KM0430]WPF67827.1 DNA-processing protein DprA [Corynebacterium sp. 21KM1197]
MFSEQELAFAYLSRVVEGPSRELTDLLAQGREAPAIAEGIRRRKRWVGDLLGQTATRYDWDRAEQDLILARERGARLIHPGHPEWPEQQLDHAFGFARSGVSTHLRTYQSDAVAPHALWVRGGNLSHLCAQAVAVVGTRAQSRYGAQATAHLVQGLAQHKWTVISGGALGIDAEAHQTALRCGGATVVIAACGIDRTYPARHARLFDAIAQTGAVVTEYPPEVPPQRHRFLTRNRLVAALSQGTVVVEAAWRSGALNTLSWAEGLGRIAMAVPGPITGVGSLGCHERIREGRAQLVTSADDIRGLLSAVGAVDVAEQYELSYAPDSIQALSRNELRVFDALPVSGGEETQEIARQAGLSLPLTVHLLVELSTKNLVTLTGNQWCRVMGGGGNTD